MNENVLTFFSRGIWDVQKIGQIHFRSRLTFSRPSLISSGPRLIKVDFPCFFLLCTTSLAVVDQKSLATLETETKSLGITGHRSFVGGDRGISKDGIHQQHGVCLETPLPASNVARFFSSTNAETSISWWSWLRQLLGLGLVRDLLLPRRT
jgi:hypothetical protein